MLRICKEEERDKREGDQEAVEYLPPQPSSQLMDAPPLRNERYYKKASKQQRNVLPMKCFRRNGRSKTFAPETSAPSTWLKTNTQESSMPSSASNAGKK